MHRMIFGLKRTFHVSLRAVRKALLHVGVTPARFDMLMAVWPREGLWQSSVRRILGAGRANASRMMIALEKLRLVTRRRDPDDKRQKQVRLTDLGAVLLMDAEPILLDGEDGDARNHVARAFARNCHRRDEFIRDDCACFAIEADLDAILRLARHNLRDYASLDYARPRCG